MNFEILNFGVGQEPDQPEILKVKILKKNLRKISSYKNRIFGKIFILLSLKKYFEVGQVHDHPGQEADHPGQEPDQGGQVPDHSRVSSTEQELLGSG